VRTSRHIFIDLPQIESKLTTWLEKSSESWTSNAKVIAKSWLKGGLQPRCITRDLKWGTEVPKEGYRDKPWKKNAHLKRFAINIIVFILIFINGST
jgi:methionyl-tRNA synthetase